MGVYDYLYLFTEGMENPPLKYAIGNIVVDILVLLSCLLPVMLSARIKPLNQGKEKLYFWVGAGFALIYYSIKRMFSPILPIGCVIAAVLAVILFFILKKYAKTKKRLAVALAIQGVLIVIFYFAFYIFFSGLMSWIIG